MVVLRRPEATIVPIRTHEGLFAIRSVVEVESVGGE